MNREVLSAGQYAELSSAYTQELLEVIRETDDIPWDCLLAGALAVVVTELAATLGGEMAARCCQQAGDDVRYFPAISDIPLLLARPKGSA